MPDAWPLVTLGELLTKSNDWISIKPDEKYCQVTVKLWGQGVILRNEVAGAEIAASQRLRVRAQQFILSRIDARNGAFGLVPDSLDGGVVSSDFPVFAPNNSLILSEFLNWMSKTAGFVDLCKAASEGTTNRVRLKEDKFLGFKIPLPPLDEQRRIVARIEALAAKIEESRGLRQQTGEELEALSGAMTSSILECNGAGSKRRIEELCEVRGGIQKSSARLPGANPRRYITVAHVQRNRIDTSDPRYFEVSDDELTRWHLVKGDVLVIEGNGSVDQIGRTALFRGEIANCVHQNHVIRVRPDQAKLFPEYLNAFLNSASGQNLMLQRSRTTSGLFNLSVGRIKSIEIPLSPLPEQRRIVAYLDGLQAKADALKKLQAETAAELDALLPSILDKAFKGEL